jgi:hypothetical protein
MSSTTNNQDNTIQELHRIRREIAQEFQGNLFAINADARARMEGSGRVIAHKARVQNDETRTKAS